MSTAYLPLKLPKRVSRKVRRLRWMVRLYVFLEGIALVAILLGISFWLGLLLDWSFEPPPWLRAAVVVIVMASACFVAVKYMISRSFARLSNNNLALLLERNYPELTESLVTTIEAAQKNRDIPLGNRQLMENTSLKADESMRDVGLLKVFKFRPLLWKLSLASSLIASVFLFSQWQAEAFEFWLNRIQLSTTPWPRRVQLSLMGIDGHEGNMTFNVARDDSYELKVGASITDGHVIPKQVYIRYRYNDGRRGRYVMTKVGEALPGRDDSQLFRYEFKNIAEDMEFDIYGGDDVIQDISLNVVERPQIVHTSVQCKYPAYLRRMPSSIEISGRTDLPEGTKVTCLVRTDKLLEEVYVHDTVRQHDIPVHFDDARKDSFLFEFEIGTDDRMFLLNMLDEDTVKNLEPYRIVISAIKDAPPEVNVRLKGIGSAVTPQAIIPFEGLITDQYAIEETRYEYSVDQENPQHLLTELQPDLDATTFKQIGALDLADTDQDNLRLIEIKPGQKLALAVQARDAYNLGEEPNIGSSQRFLLNVVNESELRALLEKRELALRQRFEAIHEKMIGIEELLSRINLVRGSKLNEETNQDERQREIERDLLRIGGALQNTTQLAFETVGVAEGFEDIVQELTNNRIETEELKNRLVEGISLPLLEIGEELMPELQKKIQEFKSAYNGNESAELVHKQTIAQAEEVLVAMQSVLNRMLELESYNELVDLLRSIVNDQKDLQEKTRVERRKKLRSLLDDE